MRNRQVPAWDFFMGRIDPVECVGVSQQRNGNVLNVNPPAVRVCDDRYTKNHLSVILPSLTLMEIKNGYKPSNNAGCSRFLFGNGLCYFFTSSVLVLFIMLRIADLEINS